CDELGLRPMTDRNETRFGTAFTVSVEAREGVTTGISAHDRSRTIQVAIDPTKGPNDLVHPGHVFPIQARDGGVLRRAGQTVTAASSSIRRCCRSAPRIAASSCTWRRRGAGSHS